MAHTQKPHGLLETRFKADAVFGGSGREEKAQEFLHKRQALQKRKEAERRRKLREAGKDAFSDELSDEFDGFVDDEEV